MRNGVDLRSLTYDRFLNVIYRAMIDRLAYDTEHPDRARSELDRMLNVDTWQVPGVTTAPKGVREANTPSWWHGDEDASQTFLASMGVLT